ncbi:MAG: carbohydrate binding family 9 domain-containing protein [Porticoccaceae bacterium]|nr:carbohydrate binding family 9 domain-containing protein [Porticoccaceae bacterium]MBT5004049.1 carbohydrate binding family 9 domain-containing protein [Porticoccaceae bacterium]MBT6026535.1 carbohydrate binding family 9 domain-containing protein [Porticoccaceae bacterium]MBT6798497.1 carbohydrate binding family 9 domain-containing protein [Porticoccaceae bacterium]MBT7566185.1 carbohydrate binding family 9 domain-containing protein [Porticoccaceae bacterium]
MSKANYRYLLLVSLSYLMVPAVYGAITIDGVLDEPEWANARVYTDFVTVEPLTSDPAKYATEVRMITNKEGIFIGFINYQPASVKRVNRRFARDAEINGDRNVVMIDFDGTAETAYDFTVGSANSRRDSSMGGSTYSNDWDGTWYSQTSSDADYWYSEIHIPWTVAPMSDTGDGIKNMAVWFSRVVFNESLRFAFPNAYYTRNTFLEDWHSIEVEQVKASTLDWFPYLSYSKDLNNGVAESAASDFNGGLDVVWRPNSNTQLTGAIKPDFGQVESDDLVVNFTAFETYVAEKRPFFTENQSLFASLLPNEDNILYTRRIGSDPLSGGLVDINAAAKITYFDEGLNLGLFMVSEENIGDSQGGDFLSSRIQGKFNNLSLGHRLTYADRPAIDREAMVQVIDMDWRKTDEVRINGQVLFSDVQQQANINNGQSDIDDQDYAGWLKLSYSPSDTWLQELYVSHYGDQFDMNDLGFMKRNDFNEFYGSTRYNISSYKPESATLSSYNKLEYGYTENNDGDRLWLWADFEHERVFKSSRKVSLHLGLKSSGWDDRITRSNGDYAHPAQYWGSFLYLSPRGNDYSYKTKISFENDGTDKLSASLKFMPKIYLTETVTLGAGISYKYYQEWLIWDFSAEQLAVYEADSYEGGFRFDWYPSNRQEVRLKFQWVGIDARVIDGYQLDSAGKLLSSATPSSDFSVSDTAFQIRYRYQLAPLSDIFLVYSRGGYYGSDDGDEGPGTLFDEGWSGVRVESLIAKIRYRF